MLPKYHIGQKVMLRDKEVTILNIERKYSVIRTFGTDSDYYQVKDNQGLIQRVHVNNLSQTQPQTQK